MDFMLTRREVIAVIAVVVLCGLVGFVLIVLYDYSIASYPVEKIGQVEIGDSKLYFYKVIGYPVTKVGEFTYQYSRFGVVYDNIIVGEKRVDGTIVKWTPGLYSLGSMLLALSLTSLVMILVSENEKLFIIIFVVILISASLAFLVNLTPLLLPEIVVRNITTIKNVEIDGINVVILTGYFEYNKFVLVDKISGVKLCTDAMCEELRPSYWSIELKKVEEHYYGFYKRDISYKYKILLVLVSLGEIDNVKKVEFLMTVRGPFPYHLILGMIVGLFVGAFASMLPETREEVAEVGGQSATAAEEDS